MLSILIITLLIVLFFTLKRFKALSFIAQIGLIISVNLLILEILCYAFFLFQISKDDSFFLIGNQSVLDKIIKRKVVNSIYINKNTHNQYFQVDNNLGYTLGKDKHHQIFFTNNQRMRGKQNYPLIPGANTLRIAAFGDSFFFGDGEFYQNTWPYFLTKSVNNFEILNFGVSGYGLGQSYLRYLEDGLKFHPDIVIFNYILLGPRDHIDPKDIIQKGSLKRSTSYRVHFWFENGTLKSKAVTPLDLFDKTFREKFVFQPLNVDISKLIWSNKIFSYTNTGLLIKQIALRKITDQAKAADKSAEERIVNLKLLDNLINQVKENNSSIIFFYERDLDQLPTEIQQLLLANSSYITYVNSTKLLEMRFAYHGFKREELLNATNHYNARGNLIYAETIASILRNRVWGKNNRVFQYDGKTNSFQNIKLNKK